MCWLVQRYKEAQSELDHKGVGQNVRKYSGSAGSVKPPKAVQRRMDLVGAQSAGPRTTSAWISLLPETAGRSPVSPLRSCACKGRRGQRCAPRHDRRQRRRSTGGPRQADCHGREAGGGMSSAGTSLADFFARRLGGVGLVTCDPHTGLVEAVATNLPGASRQWCLTHYAANFMGATPR